MANVSLSNWTLVFEIFAALLAVSLAVLVRGVFKNPFRKLAESGKKATAAFLQRLSLPAALILIAVVFESAPVRGVLPVRERFFDFVNASLVFFILVFLICLADASHQAWYLKRGKPYPIPRVLHGFILAVVYLILIFMILKGVLGINVTAILTGSAILTAVLGLALQGVLGNILAGLSLHFTRSFGRGDWVKVGEIEGVVMDMNWRETRIRDRATNMIVLPNSLMATATITNFSQPEIWSAILFPVKTGYECPPAAVLAALKEAAREAPAVLASPAPLAFLTGYDDLGVSYLLKFWIDDYSRKQAITTDVGRLVWYKLERRGFAIPVPAAGQASRFLNVLDREAGKAAAEKNIERTRVDLVNSAFLRSQGGERAGAMILSEEESRALAAAARRRKYTPGEILFRQGDTGESCYIVASGRVLGRIASEDNGKTYSSEFRIGPGGLVGEMSLFTGMPRTATVVVDAETELLEIGAEAFAGILSRNPELAEVLAEIVSSRNRDNIESLKKIKELSAHDLEAGSSKKTVLEYLKKLVQLFRG
jgi:small-conductance mechanosensitive channel/CRP-like cAMP-binding protein